MEPDVLRLHVKGFLLFASPRDTVHHIRSDVRTTSELPHIACRYLRLTKAQSIDVGKGVRQPATKRLNGRISTLCCDR